MTDQPQEQGPPVQQMPPRVPSRMTNIPKNVQVVAGEGPEGPTVLLLIQCGNGDLGWPFSPEEARAAGHALLEAAGAAEQRASGGLIKPPTGLLIPGR